MDILSVLIFVGALLLWGLWVYRGTQQSREEQLEAAADNEGMEQVIAEIQALQQQLGDAINRDDYIRAITISEQMLILSETHFGDDPEVILPLLSALSNFHQIAGQPLQATPYLQRSILLQEKLPGQRADLANSISELAELHIQLNAPRDAMQLLRREIKLRRISIPDQALLRAQCKLLSLNLEQPAAAEPLREDITSTAKKLDKELVAQLTNEANATLTEALHENRLIVAWQAAESAVLLSAVAFGADADSTFVCRGNLAEMLRRNYRLEDAETQFKQLISEEEKRENGAEGLRAAFNNLALLYDECGRAEDSAKMRAQQMELLQSVHVSTGSRFNALNNLAVSQSNQGDNEAAAKTYADALALSPEGDDVATSAWADTLNNYAITLINLKRLPEAGRLYKKVLESKKAGAEIPLLTIASSFNGLGIVSEQLGKLPQAQQMFERALAIKVKHLPAGHPSLESARHNLGSIYCKNGDLERATEMAQNVLTSREQRLGKNHPDTQSARRNLELVTENKHREPPRDARATIDMLMEQVTDGQLYRYATYNFGRARDESVSMVLVPETQALHLQHKLTRALPQGWRCFIGSTRWLGEEKYDGMAELVAIQAESQFDCLRIARTDAVNHDLDTEDIIQTLQDYDRRFGIRIYSAETDSVGLMLLHLPDDLNAFAQELLEFCMDLEDVELIKQMITAPGNRVELWWD